MDEAQSSPMIDVQGVTKQYGRGRNLVTALQLIDLVVSKGEFLALMGPSGSGKSTLLNLLSGIDQPSAGEIFVGGHRLANLSRRALAAWRARTIGFVFQSYNLVSVLTVMENVELPGFVQSYGARARRERAERALRLVDMDGYFDRFPRDLSGGERQRVAIARAIMSAPPLLLCDEPTGNLDSENAELVLRILRSLADEHGRTILLVTHDSSAAAYADRTVVLRK